MYDVYHYGGMLDDRVRMRAYGDALRAAIVPGCTVLDIGTGIGAMAIMACQLGASHVVAIEPLDAILVAQDLAERNGYKDRIEFVRGISTDLTWPSRFDVIVSDLRGKLPLCGQHIRSLHDARERWLAPGGTLIPQRDRIMVAIADSPRLYEQIEARWAERLSLDAEPYRRIVTNTFHSGCAHEGQLLVTPAEWCTLEYGTREDPNVAETMSWRVHRAGTAHGVSAWFDATLMHGIGFSTGPGHPEGVYGNAFLPFTHPVAVSEGDHITLDLRAHMVEGDYVWLWNTQITSGADGHELARFKQSTARGTPIDRSALTKVAESYVPVLGSDGEISRMILSEMNGRSTLREIAERLQARHPAVFPTVTAALKRVAKLSRKFSG